MHLHNEETVLLLVEQAENQTATADELTETADVQAQAEIRARTTVGEARTGIGIISN